MATCQHVAFLCKTKSKPDKTSFDVRSSNGNFYNAFIIESFALFFWLHILTHTSQSIASAARVLCELSHGFTGHDSSPTEMFTTPVKLSLKISGFDIFVLTGLYLIFVLEKKLIF